MIITRWIILDIILVVFIFSYNNTRNIKPFCILSMSIGYAKQNSVIFLKSLAETKFSGIVIIFSDKSIKFQHTGNIKLFYIVISQSWPFISNKSKLYSSYKECMLPKNIVKYKWAIYRYGLYYCFVKEYYIYFSNIFLLDLRDSIFQRNPQNIKIEDHVYFCEDASYPYSIKDNYYDKKWLLPFSNISNDILDKVPLNGGSVYGNSQQVKEFLYQFNMYLKEYYKITSDQGVINYIFYTHKLKNINIKINHNNNGSLYNMAVEIRDRKHFKHKPYFIDGNTIYRKDKTIPHIIHQYDRESLFKSNIYKYYTLVNI